MNKLKKISILFLLFSCFFVSKVYAGSANVGISGAGTIESGQTFTLNVSASNATGGIMSAGGVITSSNPSCVQFVSVNVSDGTSNANKYAYSYMNGKNGNVTMATITLKAVGTACSAKISSSDTKVAFTDGTKLTLGTLNKNINVVTYSKNNDLSNISVSAGSLEPAFSAGQTNYTVKVGSDVTSINVAGTAADSKATVTGGGTRNLVYGSNKIALTVKAENGSTKVYNVNVIRQDSRSGDANLKSLTVNGGSLSPNFSPNVTEYSVSVPFSISRLNVNAIVNDDKSKVSVNSPDLIAEGTTNVIIRVTAENGASKTYVIKTTRGKDPNKVLNTDNSLIKLESNIGILSPVFEPEKLNYYIYLPYEVDNVVFNYEVSDTRYATVEKNSPERLKPDSGNKFTFTVKAEDESTRTYTVTVFRAKNPEELGGATNNLEANIKPKLKNLTVKNGKLINKFDANTNNYEYSKNKNFSYEYELEDENTYVSVIEEGTNIYIVLESETGDMNVYCLHEKKNNYSSLIILIIIIVLLLITIIILLIKIKQLSKDEEPKKSKQKSNK